MRILLVGGPSSGKTTQRKILQSKFNDHVSILDSEALPEYFFDGPELERRKSALDSFEILYAKANVEQKIQLKKQKTQSQQFARQFDLILILYAPQNVLISRKQQQLKNSLHTILAPEDSKLQSETELRTLMRDSDSSSFCRKNCEVEFPQINFSAIPKSQKAKCQSTTCLVVPINGHGIISAVHRIIISFAIASEAHVNSNHHLSMKLFEKAAELCASLGERAALAAALVGEGQAALHIDKLKTAMGKFMQAKECDPSNGNANKCILATKARASSKLHLREQEQIHQNEGSSSNNSNTQPPPPHNNQTPFQQLVSSNKKKNNKISNVIADAKSFSRHYIDPMDMENHRRVRRIKYRAYSTDMNRIEVTKTIAKHMAPNFVDNVIQVSMYKNLFARATNIQERRAREKEFEIRQETYKKVKARKTRIAGLKFRKTKNSPMAGLRLAQGLAPIEDESLVEAQPHLVEFARFAQPLRSLKREFESNVDSLRYKEFHNTDNHLMFKHLAKLSHGMVVESTHPYSKKTRNLVEIIPNDGVFEPIENENENQNKNTVSSPKIKTKPQTTNPDSDDSESDSDDEGSNSDPNIAIQPQSIKRHRQPFMVGKDMTQSRVTKTDIRSIVRFIDKLSDGHKRITAHNLTDAIRICKNTNACKREHSEGREVVVKLQSMLMAQHMTKAEFFDLVLGGNSIANNFPTNNQLKRHSIAHDGNFLESHKNLKSIIDYIKQHFSRGGSCHRITRIDLEIAIRRFRRAKACSQQHEEGRRLLLRLERMIDVQKLSVNEWFRKVDNRKGSLINTVRRQSGIMGRVNTGDGYISTVELNEHLEKFHKKFKDSLDDERFSKEEITKIVHFMDPNYDGHISVAECNDAFKRCHFTSKELFEEISISLLVASQMENILIHDELKISDLWREIEEYMDIEDVLAKDKAQMEKLAGRRESSSTNKNASNIYKEVKSVKVLALHEFLCNYENDSGDIFSYEEIDALITFMDPNKDGTVTVHEYMDAFNRARSHPHMPHMLSAELEFGAAMKKYGALVAKGQKSVFESWMFFIDEHCDRSKDKSASLRDFEQWLEKTVYEVQRMTMKGAGYDFGNGNGNGNGKGNENVSNSRRKNGLYIIFNSNFADLKAGNATIDVYEDASCANRLVEQTLTHDYIQGGMGGKPIFINNDSFVLKFKSKGWEDVDGGGVGSSSGWQCLVFSAEDRSEVDGLIKRARVAGIQEAVLKSCNSCGENAVSTAVFEGNESAVRFMLSLDGADCNMLDSVSGNTLLHDAARGGHANIVRLLIAKGAEIKRRNWQGETPLFVASRNNSIECARIILGAVAFYADVEQNLVKLKQDYCGVKNARGRTARAVVERAAEGKCGVEIKLDYKNRNGNGKGMKVSVAAKPRPESAKLMRKKCPGMLEILTDVDGRGGKKRPQSAACFKHFGWGASSKKYTSLKGKKSSKMMLRPSTAPSTRLKVGMGNGSGSGVGGVRKMSPPRGKNGRTLERPKTATGAGGILRKAREEEEREKESKRPGTAGGLRKVTMEL